MYRIAWLHRHQWRVVGLPLQRADTPKRLAADADHVIDLPLRAAAAVCRLVSADRRLQSYKQDGQPQHSDTLSLSPVVCTL